MYSFYKPCGIHLFYFAFLFLISSLLLCCLFSAKHSLNCGQLNERGYNKFLVTKNMFALCVCVCVQTCVGSSCRGFPRPGLGLYATAEHRTNQTCRVGHQPCTQKGESPVEQSVYGVGLVTYLYSEVKNRGGVKGRKKHSALPSFLSQTFTYILSQTNSVL